MGSSKKHKSRDSKKKKHRSRSHTPEKVKEKHRHHKKHHKDRKKDKSLKEKNGDLYIEKATLKRESSVEDLTVPPPPKISRQRTPSPPLISGAESSRSDNNLSIEETNKLRARLGLKPLKVEDGSSASKKSPEGTSGDQGNETRPIGDDGTDMGEFVHKPAENISSKVKSEKIKQKLQERREKRSIEAKLAKVKKIAEEEDDEDTLEWIKKSRRLQEEKEKAQKRAQMLEELDAEFGVGDLVDSEFRNDRKEVYSSKDLRGLRVEHAADSISEGKTVVLTLKDKGVLDEEDDVLVNVNLLDEEKYKKNIDRKKQKPHQFGYNVYDDPELDEFGNVKKTILSKYDEEIDGEAKKSFELGVDDSEEYQRTEMSRIREKLQKKTLESLNLPSLKLASEYYTEEEMEKFKKPKKKVRKVRRKPLKASDLLSLPGTSQGNDAGSRSFAPKRDINEDSGDGFPMEDESSSQGSVKVKKEPIDESEVIDVDDLLPPPEDLSDVKLEPDDSELELQLALNKARKIKQKEALENNSSVEKIAAEIVAKNEQDDGLSGTQGSIVLNATAEFCRTLGDIPTYGLAGNRDEDAEELMDFEREMNEERRRVEEETQKGAWAEVEMDEGPAEVAPAEVPILDVEPDVGSGVAGALRLAVSKGYLERENKNRPSASRMHHLQAQNYSIEDKTYFDDDKFGRRERYCGPTSDFKEKDGFKPNVKLDYIDDDGRVLSAKEAFRYLSHKFHGKGPGKNKVEKRMKKVEQEVLMKQMSSTDTPLGTLNLLQHKQKETQSPYVVLSGSKHLQSTSISKSKV
ncbi:U4/U6.U5 tri-snRNP-associated protein 1 isoform X1 [Ischnura elegans]|uniref:U4/U6.U5 tri-snRNP-associated protein 1 isoform X1 n=2 Tax=Ischnura elegans TaxID=197161 RepID=UPI001ED89F22|nr:U4/U6.U5 tri-snRNP-associated protein 1 isoform X1 [Ischnura elegans]